MELIPTITDRAMLVDFLHRELNEPVCYAGAPTFSYRVGLYTVLRNARIRVDQRLADPALLRKMQLHGYLEETNPPSGIAVPIGDSVPTRVHLVNAIAARGDLISKAVGRPSAFHADRELVQLLQKRNPGTLPEFSQVLITCGRESLQGLSFSSDTAFFTGFPDDCSKDEQEAFRDFAATITETCARVSWQKPEGKAYENEKYTMRCWLIKMGLSGDSHAATRHVFLMRLSGDPTYRTTEQKDRALERKRIKNHSPLKDIPSPGRKEDPDE